MKVQITRLSDRRSMARVNGKTVYVRCTEYPTDEAPGTYEVDDGEGARRVTAADEQGAIETFYKPAGSNFYMGTP